MASMSNSATQIGHTFVHLGAIGYAAGMNVKVNLLNLLPHHDGQCVLQVHGPDREVEIRYSRGRYFVYLFIIEPGGAQWTRLAAEEPTPKAARDLAAEAWRDGANFRTRIGQERYCSRRATGI